LQLAAKYVRKPRYHVWDPPGTAEAIASPDINVIEEQFNDPIRASGFFPLLHLGLTQDAHNALLKMNRVSIRFELYMQNQLVNPEFHTLLCEKNAIHHAFLSLPTGLELDLSEQHCGVYECCRIGGLLYSAGIFYPLPTSTGTPKRLVEMAKRIVQDIRLEVCMEGGLNVLIWVLVLAGIMSQNTLERPWFLRRLRPMLAMAEIRNWEDLKEILKAFLWMESACDEGAQCLFEDLSRPPYL